MYYLAYNRELGNTLVGLSEAALPEKDGITIEIRDGDVPDLSRFAWNAATLDWYEKKRRRVTKLEYMNRFTDEELGTIHSAAKVSVLVEVWLAKFNAATPESDGTAVDLDDERTASGLYALEAGGLIGVGRAN